MPILQLLVFLGSFVMIWYGSGKIVASADHFSKKLKISSFAFSFLILGILTSTPEFAVGMTAISEGKPSIYMGNLIGGVPVLFLFVIPLLAIFGNGLKLHKSISQKNLLFSFLVMLAPAFFVLDGTVDVFESIILVALYVALVFLIQREKGVLDTANQTFLNSHSYSLKDIFNVLFGVGLVFVASHYIVEGALYFADFFTISPFFISLILLSFGTNLPELSLAVKAVISGKKDVAFGDYVGSATANTLLFGFFGIIYGKNATVTEHFLPAFVMLAVGLFIFFFFARSKKELSRKEGLILIGLFIFFGLLQLWQE